MYISSSSIIVIKQRQWSIMQTQKNKFQHIGLKGIFHLEDVKSLM